MCILKMGGKYYYTNKNNNNNDIMGVFIWLNYIYTCVNPVHFLSLTRVTISKIASPLVNLLPFPKVITNSSTNLNKQACSSDF